MTASRLLWDFTMLRELIGTFKGNSTLQNKAVAAANAIMNTFYRTTTRAFQLRTSLLTKCSASKWEERGAGIYKHEPEQAQVWGIGHCHIDTAWYI